MQLEDLHPLHYGYCLHWLEGEPGHELIRTHDFGASEEFARSPYMAALRAGGWCAWSLESRSAGEDLPLLQDLRAKGASEYVSHIVSKVGKLPAGVSWATRVPGGFTAKQRGVLRCVGPMIAAVFRATAAERTTDAVMQTYLGRGPAEAVRAGMVKRGDIRRIQALVLLTDLRGFTDLTSRSNDVAVLDALGAYSEAVVRAVTAAGGDVLKFMGDGILSIFTLNGPKAIEAASQAAVQAVANARSALADRDDLDFIAVLHAGDVAYGNVGATARLDFTVIGETVNVAARLERVAKDLGIATIATATVADALGPSARTLGRHQLRGIAEAIEVFETTT
jgi:adenylate cyclase